MSVKSSLAYYHRKIHNSFLWHNSLKLISGSVLSQIVAIASTPFLVQLYTPQAFGELATYLSMWGFLRIISSLNYELAIPTTKSRRDFYSLIIASISILILFSILVFLFSISFTYEISSFFELQSSNFIFSLLLPAGVLLIGSYQILLHVFIKLKQFGRISRSKLDQSIAGSAYSLSLSFLGPSSLFLGSILTQSFGITRLLFAQYLTIKNITSIRFLVAWSLKNKNKIIKTFSDYSELAWTNTIAGICNTVFPPIYAFIFLSISDASALGCFYIAQKILSAPVSLISTSMGKVLFSELTSQKPPQTLRFCRKYARNVLVAFTPILIIYSFIALILLPVIFTGLWDTHLVRLSVLMLLPSCILQSVATPAGMAFITTNRNPQGLKAQLIMLLLRLLPLSLFILIPNSHSSSAIIIATCVGLTLGYLGYIFVLWFTLSKIQFKHNL